MLISSSALFLSNQYCPLLKVVFPPMQSEVKCPMNEWNAVLVLFWPTYTTLREVPVSLFENVIPFLIQHDASVMLVVGFLLLALYLLASQFSRSRNQRKQSQLKKTKTTLTPDTL